MRLPGLGFAILLSTAALAQFPPLQPPTEKPGSGIAYLDVAATDASGQPIAGLTAADFKLSQDSKILSIATFLGNQSSPERAAVLVVDDLGLSLAGLDRVRAALQNFLTEQMTGGDRAAIVRTSGGAAAILRLSSDKRELADQLERIDFHPLADPEGTQPAAFLAGTLQGLRTAMEGLSKTPGRKAVVLFSERLALAAPASQAAQQTNFAAEQIAMRCTELAGMGGATLYAIDMHPSAGRSPVQLETGIAGIVSDTGGLVLDGSPDLHAALARALRDHTGVYRLGFQSEDHYKDFGTGADVYRKMAVRTTRAGVFLRARNLVYGAPPERPDSSMTVNITPLFSFAPSSRTSVNLLIQVEGKSLTSVRDLKGRHISALDLEVTFFDSNGQAGSTIHQALLAQYSEDGLGTVRRYGLVYRYRTPVDTGFHRAQVRVADDAGGRQGSASEFFSIPGVAKGELVMTGIALSSESGDATPDQNAQEGPALRQYRAGTAFRYGYELYHVTRDAEKQSVVETRTNLYRFGREALIGQPRAVSFDGTGDADPRTVAGVVKIPPGLAPGRYVLKISVLDKLAKEGREVTQYTDIWVLP